MGLRHSLTFHSLFKMHLSVSQILPTIDSLPPSDLLLRTVAPATRFFVFSSLSTFLFLWFRAVDYSGYPSAFQRRYKNVREKK